MEPLVETVVEDDRWRVVGLEALADRAVRAALAEIGLPEAGLTLCVMGGDDARIAGLNAAFRGKPVPTNVLSWPAWDLSPEQPGAAPDVPEAGSAEKPESLGDIAGLGDLREGGGGGGKAAERPCNASDRAWAAAFAGP